MMTREEVYQLEKIEVPSAQRWVNVLTSHLEALAKLGNIGKVAQKYIIELNREMKGEYGTTLSELQTQINTVKELLRRLSL